MVRSDLASLESTWYTFISFYCLQGSQILTLSTILQVKEYANKIKHFKNHSLIIYYSTKVLVFNLNMTIKCMVFIKWFMCQIMGQWQGRENEFRQFLYSLLQIFCLVIFPSIHFKFLQFNHFSVTNIQILPGHFYFRSAVCCTVINHIVSFHIHIISSNLTIQHHFLSKIVQQKTIISFYWGKEVSFLNGSMDSLTSWELLCHIWVSFVCLFAYFGGTCQCLVSFKS